MEGITFLRVEGETAEELFGNCGDFRGFMSELELDKLLCNAIRRADSIVIERNDDGIVTVIYADDSWEKFFPLACPDLLR